MLALEWLLACWRLVMSVDDSHQRVPMDRSIVGVVGFVGDFGGADRVSVFVGFKECGSVKECWSVLVLAHGTERWPR